MLGLLDALTVWSIALRFSQPVVCRPRYHLYVDAVVLAVSNAQMWHTYVGKHDGQKAGAYEKFGVSLLMVLALEMWTMDVGVVLGYGVRICLRLEHGDVSSDAGRVVEDACCPRR